MTSLHKHARPHKEFARRWRVYATQQDFRVSVLVSIILLIASLIWNFYAAVYATASASNPVTDIVLSNTPVVEVDFFFVYGAIALIVVILILCLSHPKRLPFVFNSLAIFYFIRGIFVSLTHLGPFPTRVVLDAGTYAAKFFGGSDFFFSGHTGAPFLLALIFWQEKTLRYIFLVWSLFFAVVVLLGHLHYTIDVLAAFFITYTIYHIVLWLFPKDHQLFLSEY